MNEQHENVERFADWISEHAEYALVDTFVAGDGSNGRRTRRSEIPKIFEANGWSWDDETQAKHLLSLLESGMGIGPVGPGLASFAWHKCERLVRAVGAIENNFAKRRRIRERSDLPFAADGFQPFLPSVAVGRA
jgi:hypothetical protein